MIQRSRLSASLACVGLAVLLPHPSSAQVVGTRVPRLEELNGYRVLHVAGSPEDMGRQHGRLLKTEVRRMLKDLILPESDAAYERRSYNELVAGSRVMDQYIPEAFRRELRALADEVGANYYDLVAAQLHGDVDRAPSPSSYRPPAYDTLPSFYCSSFAVFGPATLDGACMVGRNFDFWDDGVMEYGAVIIHFAPDEGLPFVSLTWAGIINGWTLMNDAGIVTANNTSYDGESNSLEGISTCFMLRKVAQYASTVDEGVAIVRQGPRACGTNQIIAGGKPPVAAVVEFDHEQVAVRWADRGAVCADNSFYSLYQSVGSTTGTSGYSYTSSRFRKLGELIEQHRGAIDETMNFAGAPGVPMDSINLHSVMLFPSRVAFACSMGDAPACEKPYRRFRMAEQGVVSDETDGRGPLMAWGRDEEPGEQPRGLDLD